MIRVTVRYRAGTYSGEREVDAHSAEEAIDKVRAWVRREMTLPMYYESYKAVRSEAVAADG